MERRLLELTSPSHLAAIPLYGVRLVSVEGAVDLRLLSAEVAFMPRVGWSSISPPYYAVMPYARGAVLVLPHDIIRTSCTYAPWYIQGGSLESRPVGISAVLLCK